MGLKNDQICCAGSLTRARSHRAVVRRCLALAVMAAAGISSCKDSGGSKDEQVTEPAPKASDPTVPIPAPPVPTPTAIASGTTLTFEQCDAMVSHRARILSDAHPELMDDLVAKSNELISGCLELGDLKRVQCVMSASSEDAITACEKGSAVSNPGVASKASTPAPLELSALKPTWKKQLLGDDKGKSYLQVSLRAKVVRPFEQSEFLNLRAECNEDGETLVDQTSFLGAQLDTLRVEQTKKVEAAVFFGDPFGKKPEACDLIFFTEKVMEDPVNFAAYCLKGSKLTEGACE